MLDSLCLKLKERERWESIKREKFKLNDIPVEERPLMFLFDCSNNVYKIEGNFENDHFVIGQTKCEDFWIFKTLSFTKFQILKNWNKNQISKYVNKFKNDFEL